MKVAISGGPGTGTSTLAKAIAETCNIPFVSTGTIVRQMAAKAGQSIEDFIEATANDIEMHLAIDNEVKELVKRSESIIAEGRACGYYTGSDCVKIMLRASADIRAERISIRENIEAEDVLLPMANREYNESALFGEMYGIDINDSQFYDIVINTDCLTSEDVFNIVMTTLEAYYDYS